MFCYDSHMTYIYHGVPGEFIGDELIPLDQMALRNPIIHKEHLDKYKGREEIIERKVPLLDCKWNEVVQLLPLHPRQLFLYQKQLGLVDEIPDYRYFKVNLDLLDPLRTVVYFKTAPGDDNVTVKWLNDVVLDDLQEIPAATKKYYESMVASDQPVFNYQFVPHVLYRGSIAVDKDGAISLRDDYPS